MKFKYIILIFLIIFFGYLLKTHLDCFDYNGNFHYSPYVVSFHIKELITTESNTPIIIVRLLHNKLTVLLFDIFYRYIEFFNILYLVNILGLAGLFGLIYFYYSLFAQKIKSNFTKVFGALILLLPFLEIFQMVKQDFILKLLIIIFPYQIAAFMGSVLFVRQNKISSKLIYITLLILSIGWIIVFNNELLSFCTSG
jgi:hypothetical protein